jgi:hypothetical protein
VSKEEIAPGSIIYYRGNPPVEIKGDMTLRDYFAAKAMQVVFTEGRFCFTKQSYTELSKVAYAMADAMLKERSRDEQASW